MKKCRIYECSWQGFLLSQTAALQRHLCNLCITRPCRLTPSLTPFSQPRIFCALPASLAPLMLNDLAFSKRLESVRKDVECFFGIVKGRFRILKLSIPYHKQEDIDNVFFTCCILHNMLHSYDNKSEMEEEPNWAGNAGLHNAWEHNPSLDLSSVGAKGSSASTEDVEVESGFNTRRKQLIASFVYRKSKNDMAWLS
ncbi:unnamed protein product [Ectocarpus sp. CCAP 1310/34]|nr:unnamed protein product [Ectocarpus sp. CCAP 1310/34]